MNKIIRSLVAASVVWLLLPSIPAFAESAEVIDARANDAIVVFREDVNGAQVFLDQAAGYLIFPRVIKVGLGFGAETGEGVHCRGLG